MLERSEYIKMHQIEQSLWWYQHLHALVLNTIKRNSSNFDSKIIDAGCGTGGMIDLLKKAHFRNVSGFDHSELAVEFCKAKGHNVTLGSLQKISNAHLPESIDVIISNDTLCYLEEEDINMVLENFYSVLKPGGLLIINVPSFEAFSGMHDVAVGLKQRFSRRKILTRISSHWQVEENFYWPVLLSPIIFAVRKWHKLKYIWNKEIISDVNSVPKFLNTILYKIVEMESRYLKFKPFGSSFYLALRKRV